MKRGKRCGAGLLTFFLGVQTVFSGIPQAEVKAAENTASETGVELGKDRLRDRGVIAINLGGEAGAETKVSATDTEGNTITSGVYVSWRSFEEDDTDGDGKSDALFDVYRSGIKIAEGISLTNLVDVGGSASDTYRVVGSDDAALGVAAKVIPTWQKQYLELNLCKPEDETVPEYVDKNGAHPTTCTYTANDMSVGQLDGDGSLDLIVKWDPNNSKDNSQSGYTGKVFLDGYRVDWNTGETRLLWRIDMGVNIRAGAHYTQYQVWDYDGDGIAEIAVKTADGTTTYKSSDGTVATLKETGHVGKISAENQTVEKVQGEMNYDYRDGSGRSLTGDEYFTIFNGEDGTILDTAPYIPDRGNWTSWGDNYGNRSERYLSGTGYVMGEDKAPAAIFGRGYYTRTAITAFYLKDTDSDGIGDTIDTYWAFDTDKDGAEYEAQGNHGIAVNDVDGDGCDEIIYGSLCLDHDGKVLWCTDLQHGDAMHVSDWVPDNPGLEVMQVHEDTSSHMDSSSIDIQVEVHDAATGKILMGYGTGQDTGRGLAADIDPTSPGGEWYGANGPGGGKSAVFAATSTMEELVWLSEAGSTPSMNFSIFWDGDLLSELYDGSGSQNPKVMKWNYQTRKGSDTLFSSTQVLNSNGTKNNPGLVADILGDWREEIIVRSAADAGKARLYATTIQTDYVVPCLLEDLAYREAVAWQNVGYNQPANTSYLVSEGVVTATLSCVEKKSTDQQVVLKFTPGSDGVRGHEVIGYHLYRAEVNNGTVDEKSKQLIMSLGMFESEYTDTSVTMGKSYAYWIAAEVKAPQLLQVEGGNTEYRETATERDSYLSRPLVVNMSASADKVYAETAYYGDGSGLPETVTIRSKAGDATEKAVHWGAVDTTSLGTKTVYGVAEDYEGVVEAEVTVDYQPLYRFDIGITGSATPEGWIAINTNAKGGSNTTEKLGINYTAERGYGFLDAAAKFEGRGLGYSKEGIIPSGVYLDYAMVGTNSFVVDVPNGEYKVDVIGSGTYEKSQRTSGTAEGISFSRNCGMNSYEVISNPVTVEDGQLTIAFTAGNVAGIIVRPVTSAGGTTAATGVELHVNKTTAAVGETIYASANVQPVNATDKDITYTVTNGTDVASVTAAGVITAKSAGTATIRAALTKDSSKYDEVTVTFVEAPNITAVALDATNLELETGKKHILAPSVTPAGSKVTYKYTSSNKEVAEVSASGEITAVAKGTAVITCEVIGSVQEAVCRVKVVEPAPDISTLTPVDIPTAKKGIVYIYKDPYSGKPQTGVEAKTGYKVKYGTAGFPGVYHAICKLEPGYKWSDDTTEDKVIEWKIDKAMPDLSKVKQDTVYAVTGQKLSQLALAGSSTRGYYHWVDGSLDVGEVGTHKFKAYFVPINEKTEKVVDNIDVTVQVTARTEPLKEFTVTVNAGEGGSVSPSGANKVTENDNFTFAVTPREGYKIADVKVGGISLGAVTGYTIQTVTSDITVEASFAEAEYYTVTAVAGTGGSVTPKSKVVDAGGDATFTIVPDTGYEIADVKVNGVSVGKVTSYTVRHVMADTSVEASFRRVMYYVTFRCGEGGSAAVLTAEGTVLEDAKVFYGDNVKFAVTPNSGYEIADVKVDGTSVGKVAEYTVQNVTANVLVEVAFVKQGQSGSESTESSESSQSTESSESSQSTESSESSQSTESSESSQSTESSESSQSTESSESSQSTESSESSQSTESTENSQTGGTKKPTPVGGEVVPKDGESGKYRVKMLGKAVEYTGPSDKKQKKVVIPDTIEGADGIKYDVTSIAAGAFQKNEDVTDVTIGNKVTEIPAKAFYGCKNLSKVKIGSGILKIGTSAFANCTKLKSVSIPDKVTSIGKKAFYKNTSMTKLVIGKKVKTIGVQAFFGCKNLKTITIKSTALKNVGKKAFKGIKKNAKIKLPAKKTLKKKYKNQINKSGVDKVTYK